MVSADDLMVLHKVVLFQGLSVEEIATLQSLVHSRSFPAHSAILEWGQRGEGVYILVRGTVKISIGRSDGAEVILNILGPGQVLGELSAVDNEGHSASVVTLETCRFLWMAETDFALCRHTMPSINHNLVSILAQRLRRLTGHMEALSALDIHGRVACQLLAFVHDYGQVGSNGDILLPLHLTQSDLAHLVGASRENVNRVISFYKRQGYISMGCDNQITILDREALTKRCHVSAPPGNHNRENEPL